MTWKPLHIFAIALAGWMNRQQQDVIAYLKEENRILQEKLGHKCILMGKMQKTRLTACPNAKEEL
jgi:endonuclease/exonuclease/phosphatase family metal-dependent hydrolase